MSNRKVYREPFYLTRENMEQEWPRIKAAISKRLDGGGCQIILDERPEKRRDVQNRLAHIWKGQIAEKMGYENSYVWGMLKYDILLPLKAADERLHEEAMREQTVVVHTAKYLMEQERVRTKSDSSYIPVEWRQLIIECAEEYIRSNDIYLDVFSEYLFHIQAFAAKDGLELRSTKEELLIAHGKNFDMSNLPGVQTKD